MVATTLARSARALDFVGRWKGEEAGDVLKRADSLMYEAKTAGRNRVVVRL